MCMKVLDQKYQIVAKVVSAMMENTDTLWRLIREQSQVGVKVRWRAVGGCYTAEAFPLL